MDEASTSLIAAVVNVLRRREREPAALFRKLPLGMDAVLARTRVDWNVLLGFLDNLREDVGSDDAFRQVFEDMNASYTLWSGFSEMYVSPRRLVHLSTQYGRGLYTCMDVSSEDLPDGRVRCVVRAEPGFEIPWLLDLATCGCYQGLPRALGFPAARVDLEHGSTVSHVYVTMPRDQTMLARTEHAFFSQLLSEFERVGDAIHSDALRQPPIEPLASRLSSLDDLPSFAAEAVALLRDQLGFRRVRLSAREADQLRVLAEVGDAARALGDPLSLRVGSIEVGQLATDGVPDAPGAASRLTALLPWLALGLDRARTATTLRAHEARLQQVIEERRLAEEMLRIALEAFPFEAYVVDEAGKLLCANERARATLIAASGSGARMTDAPGVAAGFDAIALSTIDAPRRTLVVRRDASAEIQGRAVQCERAWSLTARQREVLEQLVLGRCNKEISSLLDCAEATVERHITDLLRKANADSRLRLVARFWGVGQG